MERKRPARRGPENGPEMRVKYFILFLSGKIFLSICGLALNSWMTPGSGLMALQWTMKIGKRANFPTAMSPLNVVCTCPQVNSVR